MVRLIRSVLFTKPIAITLLALLFSYGNAQATHLRAGEIIVERVNCESLTFKITITVYTNTGSQVLFGGRQGDEDILDFGDGSDLYLVPEQPNTLRPDLGTQIGTASFTIFHTYSSPGKYLISYREPNRNDGVLNMDNSVNTRFYIETQINIDPFLGCNNTPRLLIPPIDQACPGRAFFHNPGAFDLDGDSLSYEFVIPYSDREVQVLRYQNPNLNQPRQFYTTPYNTSNEDGNGPPTFTIDPVSGTIVWDAPGAVGEYNIAFVVKEWRRVGNEWVNLGFVRRDMQIITIQCQNERPDLIVPADICVEAGTVLTETILGIDPADTNVPSNSWDSVKLEAFSEIFNFPQGAATYTPFPPRYQSSKPSGKLNFEWKTECSHIKEQPYQVVFKVTDRPKTGPKLVAFKSWNITVVGPSPKWENVVFNPAGKSATLDWEDYACANADSIQIWRRVDSFPYVPANCETGIPESLGYKHVGSVKANDVNGNPVSTFVDTNNGSGLTPGAQYCYRLVAVFPKPKGGESYMSEEFCLDPIEADTPVITHVTIDKTGSTNGQITVRWLPPFDIDKTKFLEPYTYKVYRGEGFTGAPGNVAIHPGQLNDLFFVDVGLNTEDIIYNYRIEAYAANFPTAFGISAPASSVRLEAQSQLQRIELNWNAFVPWSNQTPLYSWHRIYRGPEGATESQLQLIDSVSVVLKGFNYVDEGKFNNTPLQDDQVYCYRVMTRGAYGNPQIGEPLQNFSQIICTQPSDTIIPCKVDSLIAVDAIDCNDGDDASAYCDRPAFSNKMKWYRPNAGDCQNDVAYYKIYSASSANGKFEFRAQTTETSYEDKGLPSNAFCYKVSAVDRSGNEGELSDVLCFDNCPYYELPNIFTPNGDECNNVFSAYSKRSNGETGDCTTIAEEDIYKCARFVEHVAFKVFNRWGKEVFTYQSGEERTIYIDWDGRDNEGHELSTGIYYYMAEVTFTTSDPEKRNKTLKGWVHLLR